MANAPASANMILECLSPSDMATIRGDLRPLSLSTNQTVHDTNAKVSHVYFPTTAVFSVLKIMNNGSAVETVAIGREGMANVQAILGAERVADKMIVQIPGEVYRMRIARFHEHYRRCAGFQALLQGFFLKMVDSLAQSIACNRLHHVNQRAAKWLLITQDRVGLPNFPMTQEFLSMMLGVNRAAVSIAASTLQTAGLIHYSRGKMNIGDRTGLERAACECYHPVERALAASA